MNRLLVISLLSVTGIGICAFGRFREQPGDIPALGKLLFFDPILSRDRTISCSSCHKPAFAFADTSAVSIGVGGHKGTRNTPSVMNMKLQSSFFWDGRAATLEEQALIPIENPDEMAISVDSVIGRLKGDLFYVRAFNRLFHESANRKNLAVALAEFERTLETNETPFDDWRMNGNEKALSTAAKRGFELFNGKGKCIQCHFGADFNNVEFRNIGLFDGERLPDSGRATITHDPGDLGKFKIGALRNIALTAPYMHNGKFATLDAVIDFYNDPRQVVPGGKNRDTLLARPLGLSARDKQDLKAFLLALTDRRFLRKGSLHPKT